MNRKLSFRSSLSGIRSVALVLTTLALTVLAGCSSSLHRVQTWEGDAVGTDQLAVLKTPGEIEITAVNGREVTSFLIEDLALDYELLPGQNVVVFKYKTIWGKTTVVEKGESKVNTVESGLQQFTVDARAGEQYSFSFVEPQNQREAEAMIQHFRVQLVDGNGRVVATSEPYRETTAAAVPAPVLATGGAVAAGLPTVPAAPAGDLNALDGLKVLWDRASADEKREFLRWAFQ